MTCAPSARRRRGTGLLIALVLDEVGTPASWSSRTTPGVFRPDRIATFAGLFTDAGVDPEVARVLFETLAESMRQALAWLDETYGGTRGYLVSTGGFDELALRSLHSALLVPAPGA